MMPFAEGKVIGVVRGSYFDRASAEFAADPFVEDDRNFAAHQWQSKSLSMQVEIARVFRMNGNGNVA